MAVLQPLLIRDRTVACAGLLAYDLGIAFALIVALIVMDVAEIRRVTFSFARGQNSATFP
jgi:hypothetical protein